MAGRRGRGLPTRKLERDLTKAVLLLFNKMSIPSASTGSRMLRWVVFMGLGAISMLLLTNRVSIHVTWNQDDENLRHRRLTSDIAAALGITGENPEKAGADFGKVTTENVDVLKAFTFGPDKFKKLAYAVVAPMQPTDKVTTHTYQTMYGIFLYPLLARAKKFKKRLKFFEIGMGCGMTYGPGRSVALWKGLWGDYISLWEADLDPNCVKKMQEEGKLPGVNMLVGNQKNPVHLKRWLDESGGAFDVIIDDGGHMNHEIKVSFSPALRRLSVCFLLPPLL